MTFSVTQKHQNDSKEDWKAAIIEKCGETALKETEEGKIIIPSTSQKYLISSCHEILNQCLAQN